VKLRNDYSAKMRDETGGNMDRNEDVVRGQFTPVYSLRGAADVVGSSHKVARARPVMEGKIEERRNPYDRLWKLKKADIEHER
jgi:hypothetical protein